MQYNEYVEGVLRTKADPKEAQKRIDHETAHILYTLLNTCELADRLKRKLFYGKVKEVDERLSFRNVRHFLECAKSMPQVADALHGILGIMSELPEYVESWVGVDKNTDDIAEEAGDLSWYAALVVSASRNKIQNDGTRGYNEVLQDNLAKLKMRYPEKFTEEEADARWDVDPERNEAE